MSAVKVTACGSAVRLQFTDEGDFVTMGLTDAITPFGRSKTIVETPDLSCQSSAQVGREEQSTMTFTQYWDPQDADHALVDANFDESIDDVTKRDIVCQLVSPVYETGTESALPESVTWEATVQISAVTPEELTPDGFYKRTVTLLRRGPITKTVSDSTPPPPG